MRVLVVEDKEAYREKLVGYLKHSESEIEVVGSASDGKEGLTLIENLWRHNCAPDVVFTDIRMPEMDGFQMLENMRTKGIFCKIVITGSCPEFLYAKRAMELGAVAYLLKPLKEQEVESVLRRIKEELKNQNRWKCFVNLEHIFLSAAIGQLKEDMRIEELIQERYGIRPEERIAVFGIGMGSNYEECHERIKECLRGMQINNRTFLAYPMDFAGRREIVTLLYHMENEEETYRYLEQTIVPMLGKEIRGRMVCTWVVSDGFRNMENAVRKMDQESEWNLILKKGTLICEEKIQNITLHPYKYPVNLEKEAKEALANKDKKRFEDIFSRYRTYCRELPCTPQEAKEGCIHIALVLIQMAAEAGAVEAQRKGQTFLRGISRANGWTDIEEKVDLFFEYLTAKPEQEKDTSLLIQKALENIREYYDQGITLEEIAEKLHVTEEYLSSQFRKETGKTFTETIRTYRIENVKELLTATHYKLTQIAEIVGYSDPKYMSRVFKEETGMLPLEYRKKNS